MGDSQRQEQRWPPLENNPEVLTALGRSLGLKEEYAFCDVYSFEEDLLAFVPRPAQALLLVAPLTDSLKSLRDEDDKAQAKTGAIDATKTLWAKQTVRNACGTMAVLHALLNSPSTLARDHAFAKFAAAFENQSPDARIKAIETSTLIHDAHSEVASQGQSAVIDAEEEVTLHFIAFVKNERTGHLVELDGTRNGPVDHGLLDEDEDILSPKAAAVVQALMKRAASESEDINFSLCALVPA
jgi:ubiquitin carboxyl-terminal hydrolase L3